MCAGRNSVVRTPPRGAVSGLSKSEEVRYAFRPFVLALLFLRVLTEYAAASAATKPGHEASKRSPG